MAAARKPFVRKYDPTLDSDAAVFGDFLRQLLKGEITAIKLIETRQGNGKIKIDYDDPNG